MITNEYKLKKLHSIKYEVSEFHPILNDLFQKLPHINHVEYHQGNAEFGADFVISIQDQILDSEEYVGVIVKCGNIKQDHEEIDRQIKECSIPRKFDGGKKNIVLNQIWIVTNGTITSNAVTKISNQYSSQNIKFIWDERLIKLFDTNYPEFWEDINRNVGHYLSALERRVSDLNAKFSILDSSQSDVYIDQDIIRIDPNDKKKFKHPRKIKSEKLSAVLQYERFIYIEAEMGYGKSRLLRQAAIEYSAHKNFIEQRILPIFLNFRDLLEKYENSLEKIIFQLEQIDKIPLENISLLFVIDSVDEMKGEEALKVEAIYKFVSQLMPHSHMRAIFASRPFNDPLSEDELDKCVAKFQLLPLSLDRIVKFVERLCINNVVSNKLKSDLHKSDLFRSLPRTPISAILLGRVLNADMKELPSTLPELYSKYLELTLGRWDIQKGHISEKEYETTLILIRLIAKFMLESDLSEIGVGDAKQIVSDYLKERETGQSAESLFKNIISCTQVIAVDEIQNKLFFRHRTFLEFLYADHLFFTYGKSADIPNPFDPYWGAANYFYFGRLKDCPEQLINVFSLVPEDEPDKISKIYQAGSYLLAAYQSPYNTVIGCVKNIILDAATFYCDVCDSPTSSKFGRLPEIQLLALITSLVRHTFEYDFFNKALTDIEADLLFSNDFDKKTAVATFLVASVRAGLGNKDAFKILITDHLSELPLSIKYGVKHVAESANLLSDTIKRLEKKMARNSKANPSLPLTLYQTPMTEIGKIKAVKGNGNN